MKRAWILITMLMVCAFTRALPHPPNFAPVAAMALFGAATFKSRWMALGFPFLIMLVSDAAIEISYRAGISTSWGFHSGMPAIYVLMFAVAVVGLSLRGRVKPTRLYLTTSGVSIGFFLLSNLAAWSTSTLYTKDISGLMTCYAAGIPFFPMTVLGDLCFVTVLFGLWAVALHKIPSLREELSPNFAPTS